MFEKYSRSIQRHPKTVIALWAVALLVAMPFAICSDDVLNYEMTSMGGFDAESSRGQQIVGESFGGGLDASTVLAVPYGNQSELEKIESGLILSGTLDDALERMYGGNAGLTVMGAFGDGRSGVLLVSFDVGDLDPVSETGNLRAVVAEAKEAAGLAGMKTYVTGSAPIAYDTIEGANADVARIDPLSVLLIVVLLGLFFWALVTATVPPAVVGSAYGITLALMFALGSMLDIFYITKTIVLVSMLGAGCDYSVFIVSRYREERIGGKDKEDAIAAAVQWAGESVATSGLAVIIGFFVMSFFSFDLVSTMAVVLALGIAMAMLAALTLIPAVLSLAGDKVFWPMDMDSYRTAAGRPGVYGRMVSFSRRHFARAASVSSGHSLAIAVAAVLLTAPMLYVTLESEDSFDMIGVMPDSESKSGVECLVSATDGGLLMPTYVLVDTGSGVAEVSPATGALTWTDPLKLSQLKRLSDELAESDDNISYALGPVSWAYVYGTAREAISSGGVPAEVVSPEMVNRTAVSAMPDIASSQLSAFFDKAGWALTPDTVIPGTGAPLASLIDYKLNVETGLVSEDGRYVQVMVVVKDEPMSVESMGTIDVLRDRMAAVMEDSEFSWIEDEWVVGTAAILYDISEVVNGEFSYIEAGVLILIYLLLFLVLGSYFTPVRSLLTILMSVVWTLGALQLLFVHMLDTDVVWIVPIVLFVICLGLGMDYDILVTTRIREGKLRGLSDDEAISDALARSGAIISLCGLIMGGTFLTLLLSGSAILQEIGFALGFAILVDSLVVVPYVVPALMHLMGPWSWKGPERLSRKRGSMPEE